MSHSIAAGTWVEVFRLELTSSERATGLPEETACLPYETWVKGFLLNPANLGDQVEIQTLAGRRVSGKLLNVNPGHSHSFGAPHPAMLAIGPDLRKRLAESGAGQ